jgi:hypothetical protein
LTDIVLRPRKAGQNRFAYVGFAAGTQRGHGYLVELLFDLLKGLWDRD